MKKIALMLLLFALAAITAFSSHAHAEGFLKVPVSVSYSSTYWWRGTEFYGKNIGLIWTSAGLELGDTGLSLSVASGLSQDYLTQTDDSTAEYEENRKIQKSFSEFDYGVSYSTEIAEMLSLGAGLLYIHYPFFDEADSAALDQSFWELSLSLGLKTVLSPTLELFYDYYVEEMTGADGEETPVDEDYYIKLSVSHDLISAEGFTFGAGAWLGYYNNAYLEREGWSDAGVSLSMAKELGGATFSGAFYYAYTIGDDFQEASVYTGTGMLKNHLWAEFGVSYTF